MNKDNYNYWENRAVEKYGSLTEMTSNDLVLANLELEVLKAFILNIKTPLSRILEIGCGSGRIIQYLSSLPNLNLLEWNGIDYSETMIAQAKELSLPNCTFELADMSLWRPEKQQDLIYFVRSLSNLSCFAQQIAVLEDLQHCLSPNGTLLLLEPTVQGLQSVNELRTILALPPIIPNWFNCYLDLDKIKSYFRGTLDIEVRQFCSGYFLASRVFNAAVAEKENRKPSYNDPLNQIGASLPQTISNISTHVMAVVRRKNDISFSSIY